MSGRRIRVPALAVVSMLMVCSSVLAQECLELVGRWTDGPTSAVAVSNDFAYLGSGTALVIADVSDPTAPYTFGDVVLPEVVRDIAVSGSHAYVACSGSLRVIDTSDPANPVEVGHAPAGQAKDVVVSGSHVLLADVDWPSGGLRVFDVSKPHDPIEVAFRQLGGQVLSLAVSGDYAYVSAVVDDWYLFVFDVSTPANPIDLGASGPGGDHAAVFGDYLYLVQNFIASILRVIDVRDPTNPFQVSYLVIDPNGLARGLAAQGDYAYAAFDYAAGYRGLAEIDVSDPTTPVVTEYIDTPGRGTDVALARDYVYLADGAAGMSLFRQCLLFADDFESGDTSVWSASTP